LKYVQAFFEIILRINLNLLSSNHKLPKIRSLNEKRTLPDYNNYASFAQYLVGPGDTVPI
jgi:hypothetical protein